MVLDYLKVKILSLAEEAKIIRRMEQKRKAKARYARDLVNVNRRVAWHENQIKRLEKAKTQETSGIADQWLEQNDLLQERIQWHNLEIARLKRQHNNTRVTNETVTYNEFVYHGLHLHRIHDVRKESRAAYLAYAYLRGFKYSDLEHNARIYPDGNRISELVSKYGPNGRSFSNMNYDEKKKVLDAIHEWMKT